MPEGKQVCDGKISGASNGETHSSASLMIGFYRCKFAAYITSQLHIQKNAFKVKI